MTAGEDCGDEELKKFPLAFDDSPGAFKQGRRHGFRFHYGKV
jgi:hypothetical protein